MMRNTLPVAMFALLVGIISGARPASAEQTPTPGSTVGSTYSVTAQMIDADAKAKKKEATVVVTTQGVQLVDPAAANETARVGEGHLHYRVDNGPVIATTATKLSFHELATGSHTITVRLVANDHTPLSEPVTFNLRIP